MFVAASIPLVGRLRASAPIGAFLDGVNAASLALMAVAAARYDKEGTTRFSDGTVYRLVVKKDDSKPRPRTFELDP
ncbi:unnamed protein product [Gemmataceae bacterium]|nr:unnamed protein product [Gemmataceae bacterium]VTT96781.1 unnamed protein product [Gemmataceae bacterium]